MARLFGTDGVRGLANGPVLTAELALNLSTAAAHILGTGAHGRLTAVVGRDTRASGEFLEAAVTAGLAGAGVDVVRVGVLPTPALAWLVADRETDLGVMLSASHNPMPDNGIKFLARGGVKLPDDVEDLIEEELHVDWTLPVGAAVGRVSDDPRAVDDYIAHLIGSLEPNSLAGLNIVLDTANGAASRTAVAAFEGQGARVTPIHHTPDGLNINLDCGSTHLESLQAAVVAAGADLGLAFDGDADRCLAVDHVGALVDGDQILAILALSLQEQGRLHLDTVVATVMSNLGFIQAMRAHGIAVDTTKVGDRYVLETMNANNFTLGGEQSGHVILSEYATTGDGVLTGLHLAARVAATGQTLRQLAAVMEHVPQVTLNVAGVDKARVNLDPDLNAAVKQATRDLAGRGRILLRPSGTEPVVRVMVEAPTEAEARGVAEHLAGVLKARLSLA
ncbi:MAG: phosphoglucosamine mutase [Propionibacteriaceae bacterium]|jgi:phosphoglucosamine mutase|nr:phosphoglucosamine mutase [Propionibacteriaceae bacterium]